MPLKQPLKERFLKKISYEGTCWIWSGCKNRGYGIIHNGLRPYPVHRLAWELYREVIPKGLVVRHRCPQHRKDCCNPDHLCLGTQYDNMKDAIEDGTISKGEDRPCSKLTEDQVREIIELYPNLPRYNYPYMKEKAKEYGVSKSTITDIFYGKTWKHISGL